jgi:hypothetical protein
MMLSPRKHNQELPSGRPQDAGRHSPASVVRMPPRFEPSPRGSPYGLEKLPYGEPNVKTRLEVEGRTRRGLGVLEETYRSRNGFHTVR